MGDKQLGVQFDAAMCTTNPGKTMKFGCIFCQVHHTVLAESELSVAVLDSFPVSKGHALIVPRRHAVTIWEMTPDEYADAFMLVREVKEVLQKKFEPQGFNVGVNCGEAAGQSVFHAHVHVIPRYTGDVPMPRGGVRNLMPGKGNY